MNPLAFAAQAAANATTNSALVIPAWAVGVLVTLVVVVLGFAWRLALRAERSADQLDAATARLVALEARIAVIATLETTAAVLRTQLDEARTAIETLRGRSHTQASELATLRAEFNGLASRLGHAEDDIRRSSHPVSPR